MLQSACFEILLGYQSIFTGQQMPIVKNKSYLAAECTLCTQDIQKVQS